MMIGIALILKGKKMPRVIDLSGKTFGKLTVLYELDTHHKYGRAWMCECVCGNTHKTYTSRLKAGSVKSCGCSRRCG